MVVAPRGQLRPGLHEERLGGLAKALVEPALHRAGGCVLPEPDGGLELRRRRHRDLDPARGRIAERDAGTPQGCDRGRSVSIVGERRTLDRSQREPQPGQQSVRHGRGRRPARRPASSGSAASSIPKASMAEQSSAHGEVCQPRTDAKSTPSAAVSRTARRSPTGKRRPPPPSPCPAGRAGRSRRCGPPAELLRPRDARTQRIGPAPQPPGTPSQLDQRLPRRLRGHQLIDTGAPSVPRAARAGRRRRRRRAVALPAPPQPPATPREPAGASAGQCRWTCRAAAWAAGASPPAYATSAATTDSQGSAATTASPLARNARRSGARSPATRSGTATRRTTVVSSGVSSDLAACSRALAGRPQSSHHRAAVACSRGDAMRAAAIQLGMQVGIDERLHPPGAAVAPYRTDQPRPPLELGQHPARVLPAGQRARQAQRNRVADAGRLKELHRLPGQRGQHLPHQVVGDRALVTGEIGEEGLSISGPRHRGRGEPKTGRPAVGLAVQPVELDVGEREVQPMQERLGLFAVEAQPIAAQLGQPPLRTEPLKTERRIEPTGQDDRDTPGTIAQETADPAQRGGVGDFVDVVEHQPQRTGQGGESVAQLGEELRTARSAEVPSGIGRPSPQTARRRHRSTPRRGCQHRAPQPARVIVVAVDPHPRRVRIVRDVDPVRQQRGLAVTRGRAQQRHVDGTIELAPQPRAVNQVGRKLRDRDLGFRDAPHRHHPQATAVAAAGVRGSTGNGPEWPLPSCRFESGLHRDEVASSFPDDRRDVMVVPITAG